ncbi:MAG TPA: sugar ABC transporter ATP-binding protein [Acidobacteriota bacterium]|nr:sugar ABC transporter ATP-binding protein [Acidobacteriota bacterium]
MSPDDGSETLTTERRPEPGVQPVLQMTGIRKAFPGVQALRSASFNLLGSEIHALVGENGAGKSTLIKVLTGVHGADRGQIRLFGRQVAFHSPVDALRAGIATIYQEFTLVGSLPVRANLFLGRERTRRGLIDAGFERGKTESVFGRLGADIDPDRLVTDLTVAQQQLVEIGRALLAEARILVMDEPTAALAPREVERLFAILRDLAARGIGIIFVTHRLDEVFAIADRVTVMRDGETIITRNTGELSRHQLIEHMVGRPIEDEFPKVRAVAAKRRLEVRRLSGGRIHEVSFYVRQGEVLALAGLMGAGRTEVARLIFGADRKEGGDILLDGHRVEINSPRDAIRHGICLLTEDRKAQGLILKASAKDNFALPNLASWSRLGFIDHTTELSRFRARVQDLNIRLAGPGQLAAFLSGGNQQKLLVARWLETNSQVILFDEPTRGIDVGAKYEMYLLIGRLAAQGKAIIVISSELPEVLGISDRILVMRDGEIAGEIEDVAKATQEDIMALAV